MNNLDPISFFFNLPLYTKVQITSSNEQQWKLLINANQKFDYYNPVLKENTTYKSLLSSSNHEWYLEYGGISSIKLECLRSNEEARIYFFFDADKQFVIKIGQFPSIADFHIAQIKEYDKVLSKEKLKEFTRAIGLAANGVGIGSFVYLRRIFEDLIEEAHSKAKQDMDWNEQAYSKQRMGEKIELLQNHLPNFLVENKTLYGILSKGVHELDENECLAYFDVVKTGIELILDEKVEIIEKQKKLEEAKKRISQLTEVVNKRNNGDN